MTISQSNISNKYCKKVIEAICILVLLIGTNALAQDASDYVQIPKSPEAKAFEEYGNTSVSMYTGNPDISIPLHTVRGRKLSMPITLTNSGRAIRVNQVSTNVGLGWNLNVGGMVTRNVNGLPDDYIDQLGYGYYVYYGDVYPGYGPSVKDQFELYKWDVIRPGVSTLNEDPDLIRNYLLFRRDVEEKKIDVQPDTYSFNMNGLSGTFYLQYDSLDNGKIVGICLDQPDFRIRAQVENVTTTGAKTIAGFYITDPYGVEYRFMQPEHTRTHDDNNSGGIMDAKEYYSSWQLTTMRSYDNTDVISFNYSTPSWWDQQQLINGATMFQDNNEGTTAGTQTCNPSPGPVLGFPVKYEVKQAELTSINVNGDTRVTFIPAAEEREDLYGKNALFVMTATRNGIQTNKVKFLHSYMGDTSSIYDWDSRLILNGVRIYGQKSFDPLKYDFSYYGPELPPRDSHAQDYWGYYNGASDTQELIPSNPNYDDQTLTGGNRKSNENYAIAGMIRSITYPTRGSTEFNYNIPSQPSNIPIVTQNTLKSVALTGGTNSGIAFCDDVVPEEPFISSEKVFIPDSGAYYIELNVNGSPGTLDPYFLAGIFAGGGSYCDVYEDPMIFKQSGSNPQNYVGTHVLNQGLYTLMVANNMPGMHLELRVYQEILTYPPNGLKIGAMRLQKIVDKDTDGSIAKTRYYHYDNLSWKDSVDITVNFLETDGGSRITLHQPPIFEKLISRENYKDAFYECEYLERYANNQATQTPYIVTYPIVTEIEVDHQGNYNGMNVYEFEDKSEAQGVRPYMSLAPKNGKLISKQVYKRENGENMLVQKEESEYKLEYSPYHFRGFYLESIESSRQVDLKLFELSPGSDTLFYDYREMLPNPLIQGTLQACLMTSPGQYTVEAAEVCPVNLSAVIPGIGVFIKTNFIICNNTTPFVTYTVSAIDCLKGGPQDIIEQRVFASSVHSITPSKTTTTIYEDGDSLQTVSNYLYAGDFVKLKSTSTTDSKGSTLVTEYAYPHDDIFDPILSSLISDHRVSEVINTRTSQNTILVSEQNITYDATLSGAGYFVPKSVQISKAGGTLEDRIVFNKYDEYNNILEVVDKGGIVHTYLWGYEGSQVIARISGATFTEVTSILGDPVPLLGPDGYSLSATQHMALMNGLPQAQTTSFTYENGSKVSSQTDPNGITATYEYDHKERLIYIRDHEGNMLKQFEYNIAGSN